MTRTESNSRHTAGIYNYINEAVAESLFEGVTWSVRLGLFQYKCLFFPDY